MKIAGCQPDSGNPTVRDERGAYGNVSDGGMRNPLHKLKRCMSETLGLRLRAPYFYPTSGACIHRGSLGIWESHLSPCTYPGLGDRATKGPGVTGQLPPGHEPCGDTTNATESRQGIGTRAPSEVTRDGHGGSLSGA
jgi:hypothetical protein